VNDPGKSPDPSRLNANALVRREVSGRRRRGVRIHFAFDGAGGGAPAKHSMSRKARSRPEVTPPAGFRDSTSKKRHPHAG
jgi:hypothetical protein